MTRILRFALLCSMSMAFSSAFSDATIVVHPSENRGTWEGWGTSLCWWGNGVGRSAYESTFADLMFTEKTVPLLDKDVPGLGLNLLRYNIGGGGRPGDIEGVKEEAPSILPWHRNIEGFWVRGTSDDPSSECWDWTRDANQRSVMAAARDRGVRFEFFSNAPMWWMTYEKSSAGGRLQPWNRRDFARYLAVVTQYAQTHWGVKVETLEPFNEPIAGWWNYPKNQEGCNIDRETQAEILRYLRQELDARKLQSVKIAASDENSMTQARLTHEFFKAHSVDGLIGQVNVHGYRGISLWHDNAARAELRKAVGSKPLWMSEVGDPDGGGIPLARNIVEDINFLRPSAWVYWQAIEPSSGWGLVNADFGTPQSRFSPERAKPTWIYTKYYVFGQFTRFIRPGMRMLGSSNDHAVVGYDAAKKRLSVVFVNLDGAQKVSLDLSGFRSVGPSAVVTLTNAAGPKVFVSSSLTLAGKRLSFEAEPNSVYSVSVEGVRI